MGETLINRGFVRIDEGQLHIRTCGESTDGHLPVYIAHPSPTSARGMEPFIKLFGETRLVIAPDTLGNGDSPPPALETPEIDYFADSVVRTLDAMKIDKVDFYGSHTGGRIGCELAMQRPDRVRCVVLDGIVEYEPELKKQILENYAPAIQPDDFGGHLSWAFQFIRDQAFFFPYFMRDAKHALKNPGISTELLHLHTVDVLKAITTYHKPYMAAFRYPARERMPHIKVPALVIAADTDSPHLIQGSEKMAALSQLAEMKIVGPGVEAKVAAATEFFERL